MSKTYKYTDKWGDEIVLRFARGEYSVGGGLYVECHCLNVEEDGEEWWEEYAPITVNLGTGDQSPFAYADFNNSGSVIRWLVENGLAVLTGESMPSGFLTRFHLFFYKFCRRYT